MNGSLRKTLSELESAATSNLGGTDSVNTSEATSASTRASSVSVSAAAAALSAQSSAASALAAGNAADTKAESASTRASSVSLSTATLVGSVSTATVAADSKAASNATGMLTQNLAKMNVGTVQNSDAALRISTAGDYAIGGVLYTMAASSAVFTLAGTTLTSSQVCMFLLALDSAGAGQVTQGNIAATSGACSLPATPANQCPVGQLIIVAGDSQYEPGTTTFSQTASAGGSVVFSDLMRRS